MATGFVGGGQPSWSTQRFEFGALTKASAGAVQIVSTIGAITSASITAGDASGHWAVSSSGSLSPSSTGDSADLNGGPYTLTVLLNGSLSVTVTIAILPSVWSVASATEWSTAGGHASLALGDEIQLRTAAYNPAQADVRISRSSPPSGTFVAPSLIDEVHPRKGHDLDTGNFVVCRPHTGARPVVHRMQLDNANGGGKYFRFTGLKCYRPVLSNAADPSAAGVAFINSVTDSAIDNCEYWSDGDKQDGSSTGACHDGIYTGGANTARIFIRDNHIHDVRKGMQLIGPDVEVVGNVTHDFWIDAIQKSGSPTNFLYAWNKCYNLKAYDAIIGAHPDFLQFVIGGTSDYDNVQMIGNLHWRGAGREGFADGQGYFGLNTGSPGLITDVVIAGNLYFGSFIRGISVDRLQGAAIRSNTIIYDFDGNIGPSVNSAGIYMTACDACDVQDNIVETSPSLRISDSTPINASTLANNVNGDPDATSGASSFEELFVDCQDGAGMVDPLMQLAIKPGSAADTASPKAGAIGTGYVDFVKRETYFPWE